MIRISSVWLVTITFTLIKTGITTFAFEWSYKHQEHWPEVCLRGHHQSPVPLSMGSATERMFPSFQFADYDALYPATITNNGHTVELRPSTVSKPRIYGGGLTSSYILDSLHFHWDSEHTIDDKRFPLELHLVHFNEAYGSVKKALEYEDGVAVLAVLFYISPDDDSELNPVYNAINNLTQRRVKTNIGMPITNLELDDFLPRDRAGFYRYHGSLTTPPCTERVVWTVFTNGLPISRYQLETFSKLRADKNETIVKNYRPLQELNDRVVEVKLSHMESSGISNFVKVSTSSLTLMLLMALLRLIL